MQKTTDFLASRTALTTVSIDTRAFFGSGEKETRTCALPTVTGLDHPAPWAVKATAGSPCKRCCRSEYREANSGESKMCSRFAWLVSPSGVKFADPIITLPPFTSTRNLSCIILVFERGWPLKLGDFKSSTAGRSDVSLLRSSYTIVRPPLKTLNAGRTHS